MLAILLFVIILLGLTCTVYCKTFSSVQICRPTKQMFFTNHVRIVFIQFFHLLWETKHSTADALPIELARIFAHRINLFNELGNLLKSSLRKNNLEQTGTTIQRKLPRIQSNEATSIFNFRQFRVIQWRILVVPHIKMLHKVAHRNSLFTFQRLFHWITALTHFTFVIHVHFTFSWKNYSISDGIISREYLRNNLVIL